MPSLNAPPNPDGNRHYEPNFENRSCAYIPSKQVAIAVVQEARKTMIVGAYSDPRTAMDAARRTAPDWASPHVRTRRLHRTKEPFPIE